MLRFEGQLTGEPGVEHSSRLLVRRSDDIKIKARCGLRSAPKKNPNKLRVIMDARPANIIIPRITVALVFFSLAMLLGVWSLLCNNGEVFMLSVDYRHFYYQLRLPTYLELFFVIAFGTRLYVPAALPMGYHNSCVMGQAHTWASTLFREPRDPPLGIADSEVSGTEMIRMAWLYGEFVQRAEASPTEPRTRVGAVFVLLDGVFVITNSKELRDAWNERLRRNENIFNIVRKVPDVGDYPEVADPGTPIAFSGIEFKYPDGHRPTSCRPLRLDVNAVNLCRSVIGLLCYDIRARRISLLDEPGLREAARRVGAERHNRGRYQFTETEKTVLGRLDAVRQRNDYVPPATLEAPDVTIRTCTDAHPRGTGHVDFDGSGNVIAEHRGFQHAEPVGDQAEMEMVAVANRAVAARDKYGPGTKILMIVGVDADAVRHAVTKMDSPTETMAFQLRRIRDSKVVVRACRVPGEENCADGPSRGNPPQPERIEPTWRRINAFAQLLEGRYWF